MAYIQAYLLTPPARWAEVASRAVRIEDAGCGSSAMAVRYILGNLRVAAALVALNVLAEEQMYAAVVDYVHTAARTVHTVAAACTVALRTVCRSAVEVLVGWMVAFVPVACAGCR